MPKVIDLFCGAGGLSYGFEEAGFDVVAGCDIEARFGETFEANHKNAKFIHAPVAHLKGGALLQQTGMEPGELDVLVGGPPCQAYSVYNHQRGMDDPRSELFEDYLKIVGELQPAWLVMENVTGILSIEKGALIDRIKGAIRALGYADVDHYVLKAEEYGVPQERRRVVFIANRLGLPVIKPKPTRSTPNFVTVWDAIGDLPAIHPDQNPTEGVKYACEPMNDFQAWARGKLDAVTNHRSPRLGPANQERLRHIPEGGHGAISRSTFFQKE
ncbi:DNA cytosine methyltransferase [Erythrobacter sp. JK5]|uniref:DNA cytosine methyltransferase n=1 Tax=Erythrobacter sp. JK5 TaxID=2829500 RepID=UPI001BAB6A9C|nr:DNA cytosine methyltransferase [Erythrobacter sp. JK5]QUL37024.1 DNA cytosine methyltransferase [Erythrobacter sp. JK5]